MAPKVLIKSLQTPRCDIYPRTIVKVQPNTCPNKNQEGTWEFHHKWSAGLWDCYNKTLKIGLCYYIEVSSEVLLSKYGKYNVTLATSKYGNREIGTLGQAKQKKI